MITYKEIIQQLDTLTSEILFCWAFSQEEISKGYWPGTRGYVIYSPRGVPEGTPRGEYITYPRGTGQ